MNIDEKLLERAQELAGPMDRSTLLNTALKALITRQAARRMALLAGSEPGVREVPRPTYDLNPGESDKNHDACEPAQPGAAKSGS